MLDNPYATEYSASGLPSVSINGITNEFGAATLYKHETGNNQLDTVGNKTAINAFIESGDFEMPMEGSAGEFFGAPERKSREVCSYLHCSFFFSRQLTFFASSAHLMNHLSLFIR